MYLKLEKQKYSKTSYFSSRLFVSSFSSFFSTLLIATPVSSFVLLFVLFTFSYLSFFLFFHSIFSILFLLFSFYSSVFYLHLLRRIFFILSHISIAAFPSSLFFSNLLIFFSPSSLPCCLSYSDIRLLSLSSLFSIRPSFISDSV